MSAPVSSTNPAGEVIEEPSLESQSLESEAVKLLSEKDYNILKAICVAIGKDGMTVEEACTLANVDHEHLKALCLKHPVILKIIGLKELEYKRSLLKSLSQKARSGDDKLATWLLERRYPDEFGVKKKSGDNPNGEDALGAAIAFIQESGDSTGIIQRRSVIMQMPVSKPDEKKSSGKDEMIKRLQGFLT